ncbi:PAS domain-containing sensor histidine kinase [Robertmurraya kyonggiensis]|uniref:PAS domain-containing sensor histidine kinase n=1 Tax=Robertmurraya kyonggiensis TaxID=1037680 RepID=UPI001FE6CDA6|nr:PAS domain S-box protein [Robertmurraya kyonggiensis]
MENKDSYKYLFDTILNNTVDMLFIVDKNRHLVYATPSCYKTTGYNPEELLDRDLFLMLHPDDKEYMLQRHKNLLDSQKKNSTEYRIITKGGEIRHFECKTTPLPDTENYLQVVSVRDNTERKLMEIELESRKNRYQVLQESLKNFSGDLSLVMKLADLEDRLIKELETILPGSEPNLLSFDLKDFSNVSNELPPEFANLKVGKIETIKKKTFIKIGELKRKVYILSLNAGAVHEKMESIWLETFSQYTMMVFENLHVIENLIMQLEETMQNWETPQWVLRLLFNLQEQQRMTLSSDLHDTVLQDQIDLYRRLESLLNKYEIEKDSKAKLKEIEQGLLDIIHKIRVTCNELRPPLLRELGLERALENLFEHIQVTSTFKINFTAENTSFLNFNEEQTIGIYRIVQELLNNAENHSRASVLNFNIHCNDFQLKMEYTDDGIGLDTVKLNPSFNSMGLTGITQRVQSLGGKIELFSKPGNGLKVFIELPINDKRGLL